MGSLEELKTALRDAEAVGDERAWPEAALALLREAGCWRSVVPAKFGGAAAAPQRQLEVYEAVAWGSLSAALILTQHDGACELLADCDNDALAERVLPSCARGDTLTTVGISQLTTSRRSNKPAMAAEADRDGYRLNGVMPWVTSAPKADHIVTGAVMGDGQQILACVAPKTPGVTVGDPMRLMALESSWTCEVRCDDVRVTADELMRGPLDRVLALRAPVKPLSVSAVGVGVAGRLLDEIGKKAAGLPQASKLLSERLPRRVASVRDRLYAAAGALNDPSAEVPAMDIRVAVNEVVVRLASTLLTVSKGSGYLLSHSAQRLVREAMFFLVWSAPPHVQAGTLEAMWGRTAKNP